MTRDEQIACLQELARVKADLEKLRRIELVIARMEVQLMDMLRESFEASPHFKVVQW